MTSKKKDDANQPMGRLLAFPSKAAAGASGSPGGSGNTEAAFGLARLERVWSCRFREALLACETAQEDADRRASFASLLAWMVSLDSFGLADSISENEWRRTRKVAAESHLWTPAPNKGNLDDDAAWANDWMSNIRHRVANVLSLPSISSAVGASSSFGNAEVLPSSLVSFLSGKSNAFETLRLALQMETDSHLMQEAEFLLRSEKQRQERRAGKERSQTAWHEPLRLAAASREEVPDPTLGHTLFVWNVGAAVSVEAVRFGAQSPAISFYVDGANIESGGLKSGGLPLGDDEALSIRVDGGEWGMVEESVSLSQGHVRVRWPSPFAARVRCSLLYSGVERTWWLERTSDGVRAVDA